MKVLLSRIPEEYCDKLQSSLNLFGIESKRLYCVPSTDYTHINLHPWKSAVTFKQLVDLLEKESFDLVVHQQPYHWFTDLVKEACSFLGIKSLFTNVCHGGRFCFDEYGVQYSTLNLVAMHYEKINFIPEQIVIPTKWEQSNFPFDKKLDRANTIVLFGQVQHDMAVNRLTGVINYHRFLEEMVKLNPNTNFILKLHPIEKETHGLVRYRNVFITDCNLQDLFDKYDYFGAFSSGTILEGISQGKRFISSGYGYTSDPDITYFVNSFEHLQNIVEKVSIFEPNPNKIKKLLYFVDKLYLLNPEDERLYSYITEGPEKSILSQIEDLNNTVQIVQ